MPHPKTRNKRTAPLFEQLEPRCVPATTLMIGGTTLFTFTDTDGDTVSVRISGAAGTAVLEDADLGVVDSDITKVTITGASSDFTLTYSFDASGGGANVVTMGDITSDRTILGVFSVPRNAVPKGTFTLGSFIGPGFSLDGGLSADLVAGNGAGVGIDVRTLPNGRVINIRDDFDADLIVQGDFGGTVNVGGDVAAASLWSIGGKVASTGLLGAVGGDFNGDVDVSGAFSGAATIGGDANGSWLFRSNVLSGARLLADSWADVETLRHWAGRIVGVTSSVSLTVGGNLYAPAVVQADGDITLAVTSVLSGAHISSGSSLTATVAGNAAGKWTAESDISLTVVGKLTGAQVDVGDDVTLAVSSGISRSLITAQSDIVLDVISGGISDTVITGNEDLTADITGNVIRSRVAPSNDAYIDVTGNILQSELGSGSQDMELAVSGNVVRSTLYSLESDVTATIGGHLLNSSVVGGDSDDVNLKVDGDISRSEILGPSDVTLDVGGSLLNSKVIVNESGGLTINVDVDVLSSTITVDDTDLTMTVGRNLSRSTVVADDDVTAIIGNDLSDSRITSMDSDISLSVTGNMTRSTATAGDSGADVAVTVLKNFTSSTVTAGEDLTVSVTGNFGSLAQALNDDLTLTVGGVMSGQAVASDRMFADLVTLNGSLGADSIDLDVSGNVGSRGHIQARVIDDFNADGIGFRVAGTFAGIVDADLLDSDVGGGSSLVGGDVLATAKINVNTLGDTADEDFTFGGNFLGELAINDHLDVDLGFAGNVRRVIIGGNVGLTGAVNTIFVGGRLTFLSSNSLFDETVAGFDGEFEDGAAVVTGLLDTVGGFVKVVPTV